ncbi:MAG: zinc ribbon domain-containing protein [Oscillospiraceae bacterium]|nr:zinc ribbon domain-containing protein [Oscillospiraceae bacterium]
MNCKQCGASNRDGSAFCKRCGSPLNGIPSSPGQQSAKTQSAVMLCPNCGRQIRGGAAFCKYCGASPQAAGASQKDPWLGLRIVLSFLCVGLLAFGAWKAPGKIRERIEGGKPSEVQNASTGQSSPTTPTGPAETGQSVAPSKPEDLAARYAQIDAMLENGTLDEPEPTMHDDYTWFNGDPEGWVEATEEGGEAP